MSFGPGNICWGVSSGIDLLDWVSINGRFMMGQISGSDSYAQDAQKKQETLVLHHRCMNTASTQILRSIKSGNHWTSIN